MATPLRVLMIEDSEADSELVLRLLRKGGYQVESRRVDSARALAVCLDGPSWDIVISDYSMPGFSGTAALAMIREKGLDPPFIFVSGTIGEEAAVGAMRMGAQDYIMKDHMARLLPAIQRELRQAAVRNEGKQIELRIRQLEKFEALGKMAGGIAHDFNNVITAIMGWAELGGRDALPESPSAESFRQIEQQTIRAAGLTRQLLAYARRRLLEPTSIDLNHVVGEAGDFLQQLVGEQIRMTLLLASDLSAICADAGQIERALVNLCVNARDAMPDGGSLTVETRNVLFEPGDRRLPPDSTPGPYVILSVADTGVGMDAATIEHIFDPFFTTKEVGKGTGLGLSTTLGIVKQHGGFIDVKSQPNCGAQFHMYLPAAEEKAQAQPVEMETPIQGGSETLLVADDHDGTLGIVCEALRSFGYRVLAARDGEETVRIFQENRDHVSLILLDIVMPKLHGPEAYQEICRSKPGIPVIFTSGYPEQSAELASRNAVVLPKPYPPKTLARKVRSILDAAAN
jgi:two-component system cell cycle sensor histidine kinase/response regulator CckA